MTDLELWSSWKRAAVDPPIAAAILRLYADLDAQVAARGPVCFASGRCCNFERYGHLLYVTGLEIAWMLPQISPLKAEVQSRKEQLPALPLFAAPRGTGVWELGAENSPLPPGCPFQMGKLCGVHAVRPLGCRIFFCQRGTESWQHELSEQFLQRLRRLHEQHRLEYRYMEWRAGLRAALTPSLF